MPKNNDFHDLMRNNEISQKHCKLLMDMNSDVHNLRKLVAECATSFNQLADVMQQQQIVMERFKGYADKMRQMGVSIGSDPTVTGEVDEP